MDNPWLRVPDNEPYVLPEDGAAINRFNQKASPKRWIRVDIRPEPFVGRPEAPIMLLSRFPLASPKDKQQWLDCAFLTGWHKNIERPYEKHPFYPLDPAFEKPSLAALYIGHLNYKQF